MLHPAERAKIRLYLGFADLLRDHHTRLESILGNLSDEAEDLIRENLASLVTIEALILSSLPNAGLRKVDEIEFFASGARQIAEQRKMGRMYVARISIILGVPPYSDVFGTAGYLGDKFSGPPERGGAGFFNVG